MTENQAGLDRIVASMRAPIEEYTRLVKELAGENAKALTLFGAIAAGSFDADRHTARSVLIVDRVDLAVLRRLAERGVKLGKAHIAAPLIMTPDYIKASLDTFPLEFIEIKQQHVMIFGDDHFEDLSFEDGHIRLQCERELKAILIGLRQGLLAAAGREKFVGALEMDVGEGLMRTLRGLLWLKDHKEARPAAEVVSEIEKIADRKLAGVRTALDPSAHHGWNEFESLYRDVEALGEIANAW
ncbi:MAG: hypothetical protein WBE26_05790 [Phycisphaerae bacterium]